MRDNAMVTTVGLRGAMVRALLAALLVGGGVAWFSHGSTAHGLALNVPLFSSDSGEETSDSFCLSETRARPICFEGMRFSRSFCNARNAIRSEKE